MTEAAGAPVFLSWERHGRSSDLARVLGAEDVVVRPSGKGGLFGRYLRSYRETLRVLAAKRPSTVFVMQPPAPSGLAARRYARSSRRVGRHVQVIGDLHTGYFLDRKWSWFRRYGLRRVFADGVIVTNDGLATMVQDEAPATPTWVCHDLIEVAPPAAAPAPVTGEYVLCPFSYAADEPIEAVLGAAAAIPEVQFVFTGRAPEFVRSAAPANVLFPGFVSTEDYLALVAHASAVLALTTRAHTMLRAGYEAMNYGRPLVVTDAPELRTFFADSAVFSGPTEAELSSALRAVLAAQDRYAQAMVTVRAQRMSEQAAALDSLRALIAAASSEVAQ